MARSDRTSIDVVIPSIRLDAKELLAALRIDAPSGVDLNYYIVSDNPALESCRFEHNGSPVRVIANTENLGAALSRNVGLEAGRGRYVLFIDDDVEAPPDILRAYLSAIDEEPDAPGYVGPTRFPDPINSFTRGIRKSGMLYFFGLPESSRHMAWGTTSNLMVRRSAVGNIRFSKSFPKRGGGEDIDFCIRIAKRDGRWFKTVPEARVRHPWWGGGRRSYARFFRWAVGDSRIVRLHPEYAYRDFPNMSESLTIGIAALGCASVTGAVELGAVGIWAGLVILSEFLVEQRRGRMIDPESGTRDGIEAAAIRLSSELGKFLGPLGRCDTSCLFRRFDFTCTGETIRFERMFSRAKFVLFSISVPVSYWLSLLWSGAW